MVRAFMTFFRRPTPFERIENLLLALHQKVDKIMASEQQLSDDLDKIQSGVTAALAHVADLQAQIAALVAQTSPVTQAQLDALTAKADAIVAALPAQP